MSILGHRHALVVGRPSVPVTLETMPREDLTRLVRELQRQCSVWAGRELRREQRKQRCERMIRDVMALHTGALQALSEEMMRVTSISTAAIDGIARQLEVDEDEEPEGEKQ